MFILNDKNMNCNETIFPDCELNKWECIPSSIVADANNYYTKSQVNSFVSDLQGQIDELREIISGMTAQP